MAIRKQLGLRSVDADLVSSAESDERDSDEDSSTSSDSSSEEEDTKKKSKNKKAKSKAASKKKKSTRDNVIVADQLADLLANLKPVATSTVDNVEVLPPPPPGPTVNAADIAQQVVQLLNQQNQDAEDKKKASGKVGSKIAFKRLDHVYDRKIHNFKLKETAKSDPKREEYDQYTFNVRRQFDVNGRFLSTTVDIKSKLLRECLREVMGDVKGINLASEKPSIEPNTLFLFLEELRELLTTLEGQSKTLEKKKEKKAAKLKSQHLKVLIDYLDEDYAETKKALYPMFEAGIITFEYLWALFKPNTILYSTTYGDEEEPRAFQVLYSREQVAFGKGKYYDIDAQYLDYDGKSFGMASVHAEVPSFSGARRINSLDCYPLKYHKNPEKAKAELIERGKSFVALQGMNYKTYHGMCYFKKEEKVLKHEVRGRIMIDPAIFRRVNPNYPLMPVTALDSEVGESAPLEVDDNGDATTSSDSKGQPTPPENFDQHKHFQVVKNEDDKYVIVEIGSDQALEAAIEDKTKDVFTEDQLLMASPIVVGFSFSEKLWLEFAVSKIGEIVWNTEAFDSLILPENQKNIVKAMVSSHAFHPSRSIDDVIAGKGKGLVAVLHGGPGLGKTLTVESIADLLKRPLYMVSAGDLGVNSSTLERELQNILDIAHAWGAVLLLDEADVFLEKRSTHDIHRNALVSIFLRLLEYFQGILFLTTNRVEVFDDAFVSRIHLSLRYGDLSTKAKKAVWKTFITKVQEAEGMEVDPIHDKDLDDLSRRDLNGRQIKNIVRAAQALAIHGNVPLGLAHIREVLGVAQTFERDLKGGTGYEDAMRGYT